MDQALKSGEHFVNHAREIMINHVGSKPMRTVMINGAELPVPEGCPDFWINYDSSELMYWTYTSMDGWCKFFFLTDIQKRHAACGAVEWFEHLARIQALEEIDGKSWYERHEEYKSAARAWRGMVRWG